MQPMYTHPIATANQEAIVRLQTIRLAFLITAMLFAALAFHFPFVQRGAAQDAGLRVFTSDGYKTVLEALLPQAEKAIGQKIISTFNASKDLAKEIRAGSTFDVAIFSSDVLDDLIREGKITADTRKDIARIGIGVGIRAGTPKPNIATVEAMKDTLLKAPSIAFNPNGASAAPIHEMVSRLGIADKVTPKFVLQTGPGGPQMEVAAGRAGMVITLIPEIKDYANIGLELVGPLPAGLQSYIAFSSGVAASSHNIAAAKALIKFITAPAAFPTLKEKGLEPA